MGSHGSLAGKVCVITGASRGIGRACAETFAAEGARLGVCALKAAPGLLGLDPASAETARAVNHEVPRIVTLAPSGAGAHYSARCDVRDAGQVNAFFAAVRSKLGLPDVVVLNAGVVERAPLGQTTDAQWDRVLDTNLKSAFLCARAVWDAMRERGSGRLIAIGSISGTLGTAQSSAYNASKWGLTGLMKSLAEEGRADHLFCATVLPTGVDTDMIRQGPFEPQMQPADVAAVVKFLAAEAPLSMTGTAVEVFG